MPREKSNLHSLTAPEIVAFSLPLPYLTTKSMLRMLRGTPSNPIPEVIGDAFRFLAPLPLRSLMVVRSEKHVSRRSMGEFLFGGLANVALAGLYIHQFGLLSLQFLGMQSITNIVANTASNLFHELPSGRRK